MPHHYGLTIIPHGQTVDDGTVVNRIKSLITPYLTGGVGDPADTWFRQNRAWQGYRQSLTNPAGARVGFDPVTLTVEGRRHLQLELKGSSCDRMSLAQQRHLISLLAENYAVRCCRIDLAFDTTLFTTSTVWDACKRGNLRVNFKILMGSLDPKHDSIRQQTTEGVGGSKWTTIYLGSRHSERMARVYDRRGFDRFELELKGRRADRCMQQIILDPMPDANVAARCAGLVRDFVDFVDIKSAPTKARSRLLIWWQAFVGAAPILCQPAPRKQPDADSTRGWLVNTVAPTLAAVANLQADPEAFVVDLYRKGNRRQTARHRRLTNQPLVLSASSPREG